MSVGAVKTCCIWFQVTAIAQMVIVRSGESNIIPPTKVGGFYP